MKIIDEIFTRKDNEGNQLICRNGHVQLKLRSDGVYRKIGRIYEGKKLGRYIYEKLVHKKNFHRKMQAWGINHQIFDNVYAIVIHYGKKKLYIITNEVDKELLHFKKTGFELQVFIPETEWKGV